MQPSLSQLMSARTSERTERVHRATFRVFVATGLMGTLLLFLCGVVESKSAGDLLDWLGALAFGASFFSGARPGTRSGRLLMDEAVSGIADW